MNEVPLSEVKDDLSRHLRQAEQRPVVITRHGKPAGVLIGFGTEEDWFDFPLENDPRFLARLENARASVRAGRGVPLEEVWGPSPVCLLDAGRWAGQGGEIWGRDLGSKHR